MAFKAIISQVTNINDEIKVEIKFTDGKTFFTKEYPFMHVEDFSTVFAAKMENELKKVNDLETGYTELKARLNEEINLGDYTVVSGTVIK